MRIATTIIMPLLLLALAAGCNATMFGHMYTGVYQTVNQDQSKGATNSGSTASNVTNEGTNEMAVTGDENQQTERTIKGAASLTDVLGTGNNTTPTTPASTDIEGEVTNEVSTDPVTEGGITIPAVPGL